MGARVPLLLRKGPMVLITLVLLLFSDLVFSLILISRHDGASGINAPIFEGAVVTHVKSTDLISLTDTEQSTLHESKEHNEGREGDPCKNCGDAT